MTSQQQEINDGSEDGSSSIDNSSRHRRFSSSRRSKVFYPQLEEVTRTISITGFYDDNAKDESLNNNNNKTDGTSQADKNGSSTEDAVDDSPQLGVSVHWLMTGFMDEVRSFGLNEDSKIYDLECLEGPPGVIRQKGLNVISPADGRLGAAYVDCLDGPEKVGRAGYMLSYSWGYTIGDICKTLQTFCESTGQCPKQTYIWICCLCVNQHRVVEEKESGGSGLLNFEDEFPKQLKKIGHMLAMMSPWHEPLYLKRMWCIFEIYIARECNCRVTIVMPPEQKSALELDLFGNQGSLNELYKVFVRTKVQDAGATVETDRLLILDLIGKKPGGFDALNLKVNEFLRSWIRGVIQEIIDARFFGSSKGGKEKAESKDDRQDHDEIIATTNYMMEIASFLHQNGEPDEALRLCKKYITMLENAFGRNHLSTASAYNEYGLILSHKGDFDASLTEYRKALAVRESLLEKNHPDIATVYNNMGTVLSHKGDYDGALNNYRKALHIREKELGLDHEETAATYNNIGNALTRKGKHSEALEQFNKALRIRENELGKEHPRTAATYSNIGNVQSILKNFNTALEFHVKALKIRQTVLGKNNPCTATSHNNIAAVLERIREYDSALEEYRKALAVRESVFGSIHPQVAASHNNIGKVLEWKKDFESAKTHYMKALQINELVFDPNHVRVAVCCSNLGSILEKAGDDGGAMKMILRGLEIRERQKSGGEDKYMAMSYKRLGVILKRKGNYAEALAKFNKAYSIYVAVHGEKSREAKECANLARAVRKLMDNANGKINQT